MAVLLPRQGHSNSAIYHQGKSGWHYCMSKAYCKWPAIAGLIIALLVIILSLYCCLRCCGCLGSRGRKKQKGAQSFIPAPYQGYQPANSNIAPPAYGQQPAQFAQFDSSHNRGKVTEDSLPHMPSWQEARETKIEDPSHRGENVELGNLQKPAAASSMHLPPQQSGVIEMDSTPAAAAHSRAQSPPYTGPDFGPAPHHQQHLQQQQQYTGPDFSTPSHTGYSAYTPSESTRYEPSSGYSNVPMSPQGGGPPPNLQAGRTQPWRDV